MIHQYNIYSTGDHAMTISFGNAINIETHEKVMALFHQLTAMELHGVKDVIPAYTTVTVVYDIQKIRQQTDLNAYEFIYLIVEATLKDLTVKTTEQQCIEIPVCYDLSFGIDLPAIAEQKKVSVEDIVTIHTSTKYHVYMLGFLPGFAYMGFVDDRIAKARLTSPRTQVAAGSVGIAGNQTGIYPFDSPGGWNIIGRTPRLLFDVNKEEPCLLQTGNTVQFISITKDEFDFIKQQHEHPHH
ncbi:5-oxoprolinase subunit PxpB [Panacibacter ginsenosidivorans]|uniref:5-oxoprolinase subunit PxpB n=1 Tax=Panacibacter ginsenosidivorans TaxID=1813871 RepID=A0A5B8VDY1_9BACT|nr:5-oxoprolinase subunit PxpB [Panacibacter ginsenosidivorans]QEC68866.1 5-oxoprolinase subunit PxpB [Panacibacter ginsenosidivorans]